MNTAIRFGHAPMEESTKIVVSLSQKQAIVDILLQDILSRLVKDYQTYIY